MIHQVHFQGGGGMRCKWEEIMKMERTRRWRVREAEDLILQLWPRGTLLPFNFEGEEHFHPLSNRLFGDRVLPEPLCSVEEQCISTVFFLCGLRDKYGCPNSSFPPSPGNFAEC